MPDATITSTASTFGTITGTFAADQSTVTGTITAITGTVDGSVGVPGPQGPAGVGVPAAGNTGQVLQKLSATSYDTGWLTLPADYITSVTAPLAVTSGNLSVNLSAYLPLAGGYITGDIQSNNGSGYRTFDGLYGQVNISPANIQLLNGNVGGGTLTVEWDGITFADGKQTVKYPGASILTGYALESWVTAGFYPLSGNPSGFLTDAPSDGSQYARKNAAWDVVIPGDRYLTTSTTSNTLSNTTKTFTIGTGLSYTPTQNLTISYDASNHMHGEVLTYNSGTGVLTVDINHHTGSGTYAAWVVNVGGVTPATSVAFADITGAVSGNANLQAALDLKANLASPSLTGVPLSTTAAVDTNTTQIATTAYVVGNGYAKLASPTFTGSPSLPTGSIGVTQSPGNNTTALATTAFVTAAVPAFATISDTNSPSSTTKVMSPSNVLDLILSANFQMLYYGAGVSGASGTGGGFGNNGGRWHDLASPNASISGYGAWSFDTNTNGVGFAASDRGASPISKNWSKKIWLAGRTSIGNYPNTTLDGDANTFHRVSLGGKTSFSAGDISSSIRGIGFKIPGGGSSAMILQVGNGSTVTSVTSSFTPTLRQVFDWKIYSDGTGNVTLYVNDSQVATTTAGPTGQQNYGLYFEMSDSNGSNTKGFLASNFGTKIYYSI